MKIGIITQPLHTNYGGLLQNYALQQVLTKIGHDVITIDQHNPRNNIFRIYASCLKTFILKSLGKGKNRIYPYYIDKKRRNIIQRKTDYFINKYINKTNKNNNYLDFRNCIKNENIEVIIVGSDQVWRPIYNRNIFHSYLDFSIGLNIEKRIAYAASFGVNKWEYNPLQTKICEKLIKKFNAISVREDSGIKLCNKYLKCNATQVLDPTLLLNKEDYIMLTINEKEQKSKGNLFTYILDESPEKQIIISKASKELSLIPFSCMPPNKMTYHPYKNMEDYVFPSVTQWIRSFIDAEFVICDSFHGAVFSIIFNKPFLVIGNIERGMDRFYSLLKIFNLENRIITTSELDISILTQTINWTKVNSIWESEKSKSILFIKTNLS